MPSGERNNSDKPKTRKLCARLLREGIGPSDAIKDDSRLDRRIWSAPADAILYTGLSRARPPKWEEFIREGCDEDFVLRSQNSGALLLVPVRDRWLAFAFGYGFYWLKSDSYELNFGLKCALNSIEPDALKSLDISTPEQTTIQRRIQTSQAAELGVFGIATDKDILKKIQGKARNSEFAKNLTGSDGLTLSAPLSADGLEEKCLQIMEAYTQDDYKQHFGWVDHIGHIKDREKCEELDQRLVADLKREEPTAHLAPPEIVDPENIEEFRFAGARSNESFPDLRLGDYLGELGDRIEDLSVENLKQHKVVAVQDDDTEYDKWTVFKCVVFETEQNGNLYVLSGGNWYRVEEGFAQEVNGLFGQAESGPQLPDARRQDTEDTYIERMRADQGTWACLHKQNVKCGNWSSPIESCDFLTGNREFLHIKNSSHSSTLSHLFGQESVSAEAFKRETEFRRLVNEKIAQVHRSFASPFADHLNQISPTEYAVVFAVMREPHRDGRMDLPFFSKVAYRDAKRRLDDLGFRTRFSWIRKL